jgi:hypothetical protein
VGTATYRAQIGPCLPETTNKRAKMDQGRETWFFGIILIVQLVTGVETNPGPMVGQDKIDQLQSYVQNQNKAKAYRSLNKKLVIWKAEPQILRVGWR